jgi:hypothetical protein
MSTELRFRPRPALNPDVAELFLAWQDATDDAWKAYATWRDVPQQRKPEAYCVYLAAADREDAAADALRRRLNARPCRSPIVVAA